MSPVPTLPELLRLLSPSDCRAILVRLVGEPVDAATLASDLDIDPESISACLDALRLASLVTETTLGGQPAYTATEAVEAEISGGHRTLRVRAADGMFELSQPNDTGMASS